MFFKIDLDWELANAVRPSTESSAGTKTRGKAPRAGNSPTMPKPLRLSGGLNQHSQHLKACGTTATGDFLGLCLSRQGDSLNACLAPCL